MMGGIIPILAAASVWLPAGASTSAGEHDLLFRSILLVAGTMLAIFVLALDVVLLRNLRQDPDEVGRASRPVRRIVIGAPLVVLVAVVLVWSTGVRDRVDAEVAPQGAWLVTASMGPSGWAFTYPNTAVSDTLHIPQRAAVELQFASADLARRVQSPALRLSAVVLPGEPRSFWAEGAAVGEYALLATRLDGGPVDSLATGVLVQPPAEFDAWLSRISDPLQMYPLPQAGRVLVERNGCLVCHSTDGSAKTGPSFLGVLSRSREFADGTTAEGDSLYVRRSVLEPTAQVVKGFQPVMPSFNGKLGDPQIGAILEFFRSLERDAANLEASE